MQKPSAVASHHIHSGRIIDVSTETLRYANGREYDLDFVRHPGAAHSLHLPQFLFPRDTLAIFGHPSGVVSRLSASN